MINNIFQIIMLLQPLVAEAIEDAEELYAGAKQGKLKKEHALNLLRTALAGLGFYARGTRDYQEMVINIASMLIDAMVGIYNMTGAWGRKVTIDIKPGEELQ